MNAQNIGQGGINRLACRLTMQGGGLKAVVVDAKILYKEKEFFWWK